jgi:hypothetical protein
MARKNTSKTKIQATSIVEVTKPAKARTTNAPKGPGKSSKDNADTKKTSALDAAARVLAGTGQPMKSQELIEQMAAKGFWTSPGGKTPHATLHAAISREIKVKGADSRFAKAGPGKFTARGK